MVNLAIDQHSKQITVSVRNESGDTVISRQASTLPEQVTAFLEQLTSMNPDFMVILESCGFHD